MKPKLGLLFALIGILSVVGLIFHLASGLPPPQAAPVAVTSLTQVEEYTGLQFPADSTLAHGIYSSQWTGYLYCKVLLSPAGQRQLTTELSNKGMVLSRDRDVFTSGIPPGVVMDREVHSSREFLIATGGSGNWVLQVMIVSDDKIAPVAFVYWAS